MYIYIHAYIYTYISNIQRGAWPWGLRWRLLPPMGVDQNGFCSRRIHSIKRSRGLVGAMRCNKRIRVQQSTASGAVNVLKYGLLCGPWGSLEVPGASPGVPGACTGSQGRPRGAQGRAQEVPGGAGDSQVIPGIVFIRNIPEHSSIMWFHNAIL